MLHSLRSIQGGLIEITTNFYCFIYISILCRSICLRERGSWIAQTFQIARPRLVRSLNGKGHTFGATNAILCLAREIESIQAWTEIRCKLQGVTDVNAETCDQNLSHNKPLSHSRLMKE